MKKTNKIIAIALVIMIAMTSCVFLSATDSVMKDVPNGYWGKDAIKTLSDNGIMLGNNGYFRPEDKITRVECFALINRAFGFAITEGATAFSDVNYDNNDWKTNTIKIASAQGYLKGSNGKANPDNNITREEAFVILARVKAFSTSQKAPGFIDDNMISSWAVGEIAALKEAGFINGSNGYIKPKDNLKRAEAAQVMVNVTGGIFVTATPTASATPVETPTQTPSSEYITNLLPKNAGPAGEVGTLPPMTLTQNDVLIIKNGVYYLGGKPFVEISFNKFDLLWQIIDPLLQNDMTTYNKMLVKEERSLKELHEMGFRSIRVFMAPWSPVDLKSAYYNKVNGENLLFKALDNVVAMCERNDIKIVWCMGLTNFVEKWIVSDAKSWHWELGPNQMRELIADENSTARQEMYKYIDAIVQRYRNSKAVLTWEFANEITLAADISPDTKIYEGERMPTLAEVSKFFDETAKRIHANDPLHLVNSGGSNMREYQWNQYENNTWKLDNLDEQYNAVDLLYKNSACDIIDIHWYANENTGYTISDGEGGKMVIGLKEYMDFARKIGKPLMIGEMGIMPNKDIPGYFADNADVAAAKPYYRRQLDEIVDAGVQLTYWWEYGSDRPGDEGVGAFTLRKGSDDELLGMIIEANKKLKAKYGAE